MTDEQKVIFADKVLAKQANQKAYDKWYTGKTKHYQSELERLIDENDLRDQITEYDKTREDFK